MAVPSIPNPFGMGAGAGTGAVPGSMGPLQHGSAEQHWRGSVFASDIGGRLGMTPPLTPRRSASPRQRSTFTLPSRSPSRRARDEEDDRSRDRERDRRGRPENDEQPLPEGWGARMLAAETKIRALDSAMSEVKRVVEETSDP